MCNSTLHPFLQELPKCEHHLHLEGALTPQLLFQLAKKNNIELPTDDPAFAGIDSLESRYQRFTGLDDFLHYYYIGMSVLVSQEDFEALAWNYFEHASADGVVHAEVFFDPQAHMSRSVPFDVVLSGFKAARHRALKELSISSQLICCFLRHLPVGDSFAAFELPEVQAGFKSGDIDGIGLDSSEKAFPPDIFTELYQRAKALGLRRTAHAGEEGPPSYIRQAIDVDVLDVERIDHGIRLAEDSKLLEEVARRELMLSICPLSNVTLRCVSSVAELPIRKFLDQSVRFSINSDDPAYFGGNYILDNYCAVQEAFDLSVEEWRSIGDASIRGSWCDADRKDELLQSLQAVVNRWKDPE